MQLLQAIGCLYASVVLRGFNDGRFSLSASVFHGPDISHILLWLYLLMPVSAATPRKKTILPCGHLTSLCKNWHFAPLAQPLRELKYLEQTISNCQCTDRNTHMHWESLSEAVDCLSPRLLLLLLLLLLLFCGLLLLPRLLLLLLLLPRLLLLLLLLPRLLLLLLLACLESRLESSRLTSRRFSSRLSKKEDSLRASATSAPGAFTISSSRGF